MSANPRANDKTCLFLKYPPAIPSCLRFPPRVSHPSVMVENCLPLAVPPSRCLAHLCGVFCFVLFGCVSVCPMTQSHTHGANTLRKHCANNKLTNKYEKLPGKTFSVFVFRCQVAHDKGQSFYYEPLGKLGREYKIIYTHYMCV